MSIIDRRLNGRGKSSPNRKKFIERNKKQIKKNLDKITQKKSIKDAEKDLEVIIDGTTTNEPDYHYDPNTGKKRIVNSGNDRYSKGEKQLKPGGGSGGRGGASLDDDGEDDFAFQLTKEEFFDLYFEDMKLPNFIKETILGSHKFKLKRAGFTKDGIPMRLNCKKTMEMSIARRIAAKAQGRKKPPYLDDIDVRYDNIVQKPYPVTKAVMFMVMDVSGSMYEKDKMIAKKFFLLLYLFLTRSYEEVDVRFIMHTTEAEEVDEETFFYHRKNGGTLVSPALELVNKLMLEEYDADSTNFYVAQASDGDNWPEDNDNLIKVLEEEIIPKVQYMAYIQTRSNMREYGMVMGPSLFELYRPLREVYRNFNAKLVLAEKQVYPVLRKLFEPEGDGS